MEQENEHAFDFDGGDTFPDTLPAVETKGELLLPNLKQLQVDAMVGHLKGLSIKVVEARDD